MRRFSFDSLANLSRAERVMLWNALSEADRRLLHRSWPFWAHDEQLPPAGDWRAWVFMGGRGAGKTRAGAELVNALAHSGEAMHIGLIGATLHEAGSVMVEGRSGLLNPVDPAMRPHFVPSARRLTWKSGAVASLISARAPASLRGPQFDFIWADEFAKWERADETLDTAQMALRLGQRPRMVVTTTPRRTKALRRLLADAGTALSRAPTASNAAHLAPDFIDDLARMYGTSALARQEIHGEMLEDDETALFRRAWIDVGRVREAPKLTRVVVGVDPPVSSGRKADACGIVVAGRCAGGEVYVLADMTVQGLTPAGWAKRVRGAVEAHEADAVVVETNQGGELVSDLLKASTEGGARVARVHARAGKRMRAEPVALGYETGRVHHVGLMRELEDEMCLFGGEAGGGASPDRVDALVWAVSALTEGEGAPRVREV